ncbi:hypothetical protein EV424DRAFT_1556080 [Suillus variegatus]|nr:hypothetical protein EV424DRAFT_1556080 [Suillus variegatus]
MYVISRYLGARGLVLVANLKCVLWAPTWENCQTRSALQSCGICQGRLVSHGSFSLVSLFSDKIVPSRPLLFIVPPSTSTYDVDLSIFGRKKSQIESHERATKVVFNLLLDFVPDRRFRKAGPDKRSGSVKLIIPLLRSDDTHATHIVTFENKEWLRRYPNLTQSSAYCLVELCGVDGPVLASQRLVLLVNTDPNLSLTDSEPITGKGCLEQITDPTLVPGL